MDLSNLTKPQAKPPMVTICASAGAGKTTLSALFPGPVILLRAENGYSVFDTWDEDAKPIPLPVLPKTTSEVSTHATIMDQLTALRDQDHGFKTLVLDTVSSLDDLFEDEVCVQEGVTNIGEAAGGFNKGYKITKRMHQEVKDMCDYLNTRKRMTVIFLAHTNVKKMKNRPDADEYTIFTLDLSDDAIPVYTNLVDAVLYLRQDEFIKGVATDNKGRTTKFGKLVQTGERTLITSGDGRIGYAGAKNRFDLEPEIPVAKGENPLLSLIPFYINGGK
jgi:hypothetical protein